VARPLARHKQSTGLFLSGLGVQPSLLALLQVASTPGGLPIAAPDGQRLPDLP